MSLISKLTTLSAAGSGGSAGWIGLYEKSGGINTNEDYGGTCCTVSGEDIHVAFHSNTNARLNIAKLDPNDGTVLINKTIRNASNNTIGFGRMESLNYSDWFMVGDSITTSSAGYGVYFFDASTYTLQYARGFSGVSNEGFIYGIHRSPSSGYTHLIAKNGTYQAGFVTGTGIGQSDRDGFNNGGGNGVGSQQSDTSFDGTYVYLNLRDSVSDSNRWRQHVFRVQSSSSPSPSNGLLLIPTQGAQYTFAGIEVGGTNGSNIYLAGGPSDGTYFAIFKINTDWSNLNNSSFAYRKMYATPSDAKNYISNTTKMFKDSNEDYLYYINGVYSGFTYFMGIWKVDASNGDLLGHKVIKDPNGVDRLYPVDGFALDDGSIVVSGNRRNYGTNGNNASGVVVKMDFDNVADGTYGDFEIVSKTVPTAATPTAWTLGDQSVYDNDGSSPTNYAISTAITTETITSTVESF